MTKTMDNKIPTPSEYRERIASSPDVEQTMQGAARAFDLPAAPSGKIQFAGPALSKEGERAVCKRLFDRGWTATVETRDDFGDPRSRGERWMVWTLEPV